MRMKTGRLVILSQFQLEKNQARIQIKNKLAWQAWFKETSTFWPKSYNWIGTFSDMRKEPKWGTLETRRKTNNKLVPNSETKKTWK